MLLVTIYMNSPQAEKSQSGAKFLATPFRPILSKNACIFAPLQQRLHIISENLKMAKGNCELCYSLQKEVQRTITGYHLLNYILRLGVYVGGVTRMFSNPDPV